MTICSLGVWDTSVPGITFDSNGVSNYARIQKNLMEAYPRGDQGLRYWTGLVEKMKAGRGKSGYDCVIGVSGGTDSCYLLHAANEYNLKPLAVNLDNGWNSEISVANIQKVTTALGVDLETYVIDYEEIKDVMRVYMMAGLPWIDAPTDLAIQSILYKIALKEGIKYILIGSDFRSEGKQPTEWTYSDQRQLCFLQNKFGRAKLKTFPILSPFMLLYLGYLRGIKLIPAYSYLPYQKKAARVLLSEIYDWQYYGEHHHENIFTKFAIGYWMYKKFGIDKRIITYSAQILSGEIKREEALDLIAKPPYDPLEMERDKEYVIKKLDFSHAEFEQLWNDKNRSFLDYPSYYPMIHRFSKFLLPIISKIVPVKPKMFYELEERKNIL